MLTIYSDPVSTYCAKLRVALRHKGIAYNEVPPPGGYGSDEYRALVPSGTLPAMDHDGFQLGDSEAIIEYLNDLFPAAPMLPDDIQLKAKAREKGRFHDTRLEPSVRAFFPQVAYETRDPAAVATAGDSISRQLTALALLLSRSPLSQDNLLMCDCGFAITFAWIRAFEHGCGLRIDWPETVLAYDARLQTFGAVSDELAAYRPAMNSYMRKAAPSA